MKLHGTCLCKTFVLEAHKHGARIVEIPVQTRPRTYGKRKVRTRHVRQNFYVLKDLVVTVLGSVLGFFFVVAFSIMTQAVL